MKHKIAKILFFNLIFLLIIFAITELSSYLFICFKYKEDIINFKNIVSHRMGGTNNMFIGYQKVKLPDINNLIRTLRPIEIRNKNKKPIVLFGCSYTYGFGLNEDETFSRKLADYTDRTVINRGNIGSGIPFIYYQLNDKKILSELPKNTEYFIYTFIPDHMPRMFRYRNWIMSGEHTLRYKIKNDKPILDNSKFLFLHSLFTSIVIEEFLANKNANDSEKRDKLFYKLTGEIYNIIKNNFPSAKMVILNYECPLDQPDLYKYALDELQEKYKDIVIININKEIPQLSQDKYWLMDKSHPSAAAWDLVVPYISKELNLKN